MSILTQAEQQELQAWNDTTTDYPADQTLIDLFEAQVKRTPDNIAVSFEGSTLTYQQLNASANRLAHCLRSQTDATRQHPLIQPDTLVGICVERSLEMIIGLLGILKASGAYVPLDPNYPTERLSYMLADSQVPILLTQQRLQDQLSNYAGQIVCLDEPALFADQPEHNLPRIAQPHHLAYVIYTSGSTGQPKGVMIPHQGVVNLSQYQAQHLSVSGNTSNVLQFASISFDAATWECAMTLLQGATLHLAPHDQIQGHLDDLLVTERITHATLPSSVVMNLNPDHHRLHTLVVAGKACPLPLMRAWSGTCDFYNAYGPTEATVCASMVRGTVDTDIVTIGQPVANTRIHLLDQQQQPVPIGIPGELCIAGAGLARGYLNRPELTAEKFIEVKLFGKTERLYKTGDLARWLPDGNLEYLGRIDHQVKLRGFRIELGEIEAVLCQQAGVSEAVVVVHERDGNKSLAAYVTAAAGEVPDIATLRDALQARLPDYMVPNSF
ncbi:MAG: amino acid adenylation domain-containing protein, partial [Pseudomonadota bacterium]